MTNIVEGDLLWQPAPDEIDNANLTRYMEWLRVHRGLDFADYRALWAWSVEQTDAFWASLWDYFEIVASAPYSAVMKQRIMPGAEWFPGCAPELC